MPNFIGRIENLKQDWRTIETFLGVPHKKLHKIHYFSHAAKTHAQSIILDPFNQDSEYVSLVRAICKYYAVDYDCFGYQLPAVCESTADLQLDL